MSPRQPSEDYFQWILRSKLHFLFVETFTFSVMDHETGTRNSIALLHLLTLFTVFLRHDDLKSMLDSSKDNLKLDAMKRIISVSVLEQSLSQ